MDCQVFHVLLDDLARGLPMDITIRQRGLDHAGSCAECGKRLAEARWLTAALRAMAADDAFIEAPLHLEGVLLNAFEERMKIGAPARRFKVFSPVRLRWLAMAAAVIVLALGVGLTVKRERSDGGGARQPSTASATSKRVPPVAEERPAEPIIPDRPSAAEQGAGSDRGTSATSRPKSEGPARRVVWATDFLPLPYADDATPLGNAQIVRLQVANSDLASLGLPVNEESAAREITADVLVGEDGIPRAISLVRL